MAEAAVGPKRSCRRASPMVRCTRSPSPISTEMESPTLSSTSRRSCSPQGARIPAGLFGKIWVVAVSPSALSSTQNWAGTNCKWVTWMAMGTSTSARSPGVRARGTEMTAKCTLISWKTPCLAPSLWVGNASLSLLLQMKARFKPYLDLRPAFVVLGMALLGVGAATGPIRISENGRYFVDAQGAPFYFLADTQWELFRRYSLSEARLILENRKAKGFTVVMVMRTGVGSGTNANLNGHRPWLNDNPATPNPAYFTNVDAVVQLAQGNDIHLLIGIYHQTYGSRMTVDNAKAWATWV